MLHIQFIQFSMKSGIKEAGLVLSVRKLAESYDAAAGVTLGGQKSVYLVICGD